MSRRTTTLCAVIGLVAALSLAVPVLAKEGAEARLDTALPRDAEPGSTIDVGWSVFMIEGDTTHPVYGSPVYIRLVGPDGTSTTEVMGKEAPAGSGHYTASIQVPAGGIGQVIVGMVGEACIDGAGCRRSDMIFPLTDDPLVTGAAPAVMTPERRPRSARSCCRSSRSGWSSRSPARWRPSSSDGAGSSRRPRVADPGPLTAAARVAAPARADLPALPYAAASTSAATSSTRSMNRCSQTSALISSIFSRSAIWVLTRRSWISDATA